MAKINVPRKSLETHEGGRAKHINPELQLRRSVMSCLLWEREFYEDGIDISDRIKNLVPQVDVQKVKDMAIEAREQMKLRHMPLFIVRELARIRGSKIGSTLARVIQRADELTEFAALYWKDGRQPFSKQVKYGLARAFPKFDAYQLAKYNRDGEVKLKDVLFLCHAKAKDKQQEAIWKHLIDGTLSSPDTWEVALSAGKDKKESWTRLLSENRLGGLALIRNLRNMSKVGVDESLVKDKIKNMRAGRILPFRFITAARHAPEYEIELEVAMMRCLEMQEKLPGKTLFLVDVSGSMDYVLSPRAETIRMDAACGLAVLLRKICDEVEVYSFSSSCVRVPSREGFALRDAIINSQKHSSTYLGRAYNKVKDRDYDRVIVITDEQAHDNLSDPKRGVKAYVINVASYKHGVGYGAWTHVDGWSESVINYIREYEKLEC